MPSFRLDDLAARVGGQVVGSGELIINGVADPATAGPGDLVFLLDTKYAAATAASSAGAAVVKREQAGWTMAQLVVANPRTAMAKLMALFVPEPAYTSQHPTAYIDPTATVAPTAALGPFVAVGARSTVGPGCILHAGVVVGREVTVGADCILHPRVVLYDGVVIGDRVILHAGTVIGSDGYGFAPDEHGHHLKVPQLGNVILGDDVETGANVAIDRGTFGSTVVGRGTKIDNLVHIGHNDRIGEDVLIVSQTGLSGSVTVGNRVTLAGQVGVAGHLTIGEGSMVLARSGVTKDIPPRSVVSGFPARPHREELRRQAAVTQLDEIKQELVRLRQAQVAHPEGPSMEEQPYDR